MAKGAMAIPINALTSAAASNQAGNTVLSGAMPIPSGATPMAITPAAPATGGSTAPASVGGDSTIGMPLPQGQQLASGMQQVGTGGMTIDQLVKLFMSLGI